VQPKSSSVWHTGLYGGAPDSVRCARLASGEQATLGKNRRHTTIIHRTVRWANGRPRNPRATRGPRQRSAGGTGLSGVHRTRHLAQRCNGRLRQNRKEIGIGPSIVTVRWRTGLSGGALDYPVRHPTEVKYGLPCWPPTAPKCLGAIKGTP
jgi:hypothetical protein